MDVKYWWMHLICYRQTELLHNLPIFLSPRVTPATNQDPLLCQVISWLVRRQPPATDRHTARGLMTLSQRASSKTLIDSVVNHQQSLRILILKIKIVWLSQNHFNAEIRSIPGHAKSKALLFPSKQMYVFLLLKLAVTGNFSHDLQQHLFHVVTQRFHYKLIIRLVVYYLCVWTGVMEHSSIWRIPGYWGHGAAGAQK